MVLPEREYEQGSAVGIASSGEFCSIFVSKYLMNREHGFGRHLLQILEEEDLSYEHSPSGIDSMSVIVREDCFGTDVEQRVTDRIAAELSAEVSVERGLALVVIVGEGMRNSIGVAARATGALAESRVNIEMINQGSSEISMMFGVRTDDRQSAVRCLYDAFVS